MNQAYHPKQVEQGWTDWWEAQKFYSASAAAADVPEDKKFVLVIPPPNVTGSLHLGHTLTTAIQDTLTRWHRMRGDVTLWVPGVDHAGIATQSVVERHLLRTENKTRHDLGREEFLRRVWAWKEQHGGRICYQLRRLGVSVDWSREAFTMNPMLSRAVTEAFVRLFDAGLIYRDTRLVSWCPYLKTALSEIEVDTEDIDKATRIRVPGFEKTVEVGMLWYFKYPLYDDPSQWVEVATTRLETMLGDVAVAVHPNDTRYKAFIGKKLRHPFFPQREMRIVADAHVDPEFGTGAVKITPAHDKNDYEIGKRHGLPMINVFTLDGKINESGGEFAGLHRFQCRLDLEKRLTEMGLLTDKKPNEKKMQLPRCSRSQDVVEYMIMPQWWMDCKDVARRAVQAVRNGDLTIVPSFHTQTWYYWLENIKDWCISRQLWWGHRIPAYRVVFAGETAMSQELWVAGRTHQEAMERAREKTGRSDFTLEQDEDVLDTWFSSGLFPFSVFGWPDTTEDFRAFFPTTLLETGHDILFFWVARMVMMSYLLLDRLPFKTVLLHAMVRDSHGKKMSKSLGNVVDPIEAIEGITLAEMEKKLHEGHLPQKEVARAADAQKKDFPKGIPECGADALRYGLLAYTSQGRNINLDVNRVVGYRFFCNKIWNATRFALMNFPPNFRARGLTGVDLRYTWSDRWILHRLSECARLTNDALARFEFGDAVTATYSFWLYQFCDIYLELLKPRLATTAPDDRTPAEVLYTCLDRGLRLLHPMLPFVTEELYHRLPPAPWKTASISIAPYPTPIRSWYMPHIDTEMDLFMSVVRHVRSLLVALEVNPKERLSGFLKVTVSSDVESATLSSFMNDRAKEVSVLAKIESLSIVTSFGKGTVCDVVSEKLQIALDPRGVVNLHQILEKLDKKLAANKKSVEALEKKMAAPNYAEKVPEDVRSANAERLAQLQAEGAELAQAHRNIVSALSCDSESNE